MDVVRITAYHNGISPSVNYYEVVTKRFISRVFKSFWVFYYNPTPARSGSLWIESKRATDKAILLLKYLLNQQGPSSIGLG